MSNWIYTPNSLSREDFISQDSELLVMSMKHSISNSISKNSCVCVLKPCFALVLLSLKSESFHPVEEVFSLCHWESWQSFRQRFFNLREAYSFETEQNYVCHKITFAASGALSRTFMVKVLTELPNAKRKFSLSIPEIFKHFLSHDKHTNY